MTEPRDVPVNREAGSTAPQKGKATKTYARPTLTRYGSIESLTQSGSSRDLDGQNHKTGREG